MEADNHLYDSLSRLIKLMQLMVLLTLSDKFSTIWCKYRHWNCTILLPSVHLSSVLSNLISFTSQKRMLVHSSWRRTNLCLLSKILGIRILHRMGFLLYNQASGSDYGMIMYSLFNIKGEILQPFSFVLCFPEILNHLQNSCTDL